MLIPDAPAYSIHSITVPAIFLPLQQLKASVSIIPTDHKTIPATRATGLLTVYNGSFLNQSLPSGFIVTASNGVEVAIDQAVIILGANLPTLGIATVSAHAVVAGSNGNIPPYAIQARYGADLSIKNLSAFIGGHDSYTQKYATNQDKALASDTARQELQILALSVCHF